MRAPTPRPFSALLPLPALVVVLTTTACWDIEIPKGARIGCTADDQCPDGFACREELGGLCVEIRPDDQTAPSLSSSSVAPSTARIGTTITALLESDEQLVQAPVVTLIGVDGPRPFDSVVDAAPEAAADDDKRRSFIATTVVLAGDGAGVRDVRAQLIDLVGNVTAEATVGRVTVDSVAPVVAELSVAPANANADVDVVVTLRTDEAVGDATTATLVDGRAFSLDPAGADPLVRTFRLRPDPSADSEGPQAVAVVVSDLAGNVVDKTNSDLAFDFTAPQIVGDAVFSRSVVTVGQVVGVALTADENIADLEVRLVPLDANGDDVIDGVTIPLAIDGRSGRDIQLRHDVGVDDNEGRYRVDIVRLVDLAGNVSTALSPAGELVIDRGAPVFVEAPTSSPAVLSRQPGNDLVTVGFVLDAAADVVVQVGPTIVPCTSDGTGPVRYACERRVADGDVDGVFGVTVTAIDGAGNVAFAAAPGIVADFTAPSLVLSVVPDRQARAGEVISLSAVANEVLASGSVVVSSTLAFTPAVVQGRSATSTFTVPPGLQGSFTADVVAADEGGNVTAAPTTIAVQIDGVAPSIVSSSLSTPRVAPNQSFTLTFRASELLGSDPQVTFSNGDATATMTKLSGPDANQQYEYRGTGPATGTNQFYTITVVMADVAGNPGADSPAVVVVDNTPPRLAGFDIAPLAARADDTVRVVVTADETMREPPTMVATNGAASLTFTPTSTEAGAISYVFTARVTPTLAQGTWTFSSFTLTDQAGNSGSVTPTGQRTFSVDSQAPTISNLQVNAPRRSAVAPFNQLTATFTLNEAPTGGLRVALGARATTCTPTGLSFSCPFTVVVGDGPGAKNIFVQATDAAGNTSSASITVDLDFSAPTIVSSSVRYLPGPAPANLQASPTAARNGSIVEIDVTLNETLQANPVPSTTLGSIAVDRGANPAFTLRSNVTATAPSATIVGTLVVTDELGNSATVNLPGVVVDNVAPTAPLVGTANRIVYTRQPWGTSSTAATFRLDGTAGSVDVDGTVVVYADSTGTGEIARQQTAGTAFALTMQIADRPELFVAAVDGAGNRSAIVKVRDVRWTATMRDKVAGSSTENPHTFESRAISQRAREQENGVEHGGETVGRIDGVSAQALAVPSFTQVLSEVDVGTIAFDPYRDVALMPGGPTGMLEWDGTRWNAVRVRDPESDGMPDFSRGFEVAYDLEHAELVFFGGFEDRQTWIYNGISWRLADAGDDNGIGAPLPRTGMAMAYDDNAAAVTLFGGTASGTLNEGCASSQFECLADTWVWTSQEWINIDDNGGPAAREGATMAWDRNLGMLVLFGGVNENTGFMNDTWLWDGGWSTLTTSGTPSPRRRARLAFHDELAALVMQGGDDDNGPLATVFRLQGTQWAALDVGANPPPPFADLHDLEYDAARRQLLLVADGDTWIRNAAGWRRMVATPRFEGIPVTRSDVALAFDPIRRRTMLYGGRRSTAENTGNCDTASFGSRCGDLWDFDGAGWTLRTTTGAAPGRRTGAAMAVDSTTGVAFLYGGSTSGGCDGFAPLVCQTMYRLTSPAGSTTTSIVAVNPATRPPARTATAMAYDPVNRRVIMYGGRTGVDNGGNLGDMWAFGTTTNVWTQLCTSTACINSGPGARSDHSMTWDSTRNMLMLFGGTNNSMYEFNGTTWTQRAGAGDAPVGPRANQSLSFDPVRNRTILFGESAGVVCSSTNFCADLFEWDGGAGTWTRIDSVSHPAGDARPTKRSDHAMVYDPFRREHHLVAGGPTTGFESWRFTTGLDSRAGQMFVIDFDNARAPQNATISSMSFAWRATAPGAGFEITSARDGRRELLATTAATTATTALATVNSNPRGLLTPADELVVWAETLPGGAGPQQISTDAVEATVVYRLP